MTPHLTLPHPLAIEFLNPGSGFIHTDRTLGLKLQLFGSTSHLSYTKLLSATRSYAFNCQAFQSGMT